MRHTIDHGPAFTTLSFECEEGEIVVAQPGVLLGMTTGFEVKAKMGSQMTGSGKVGRSLRSLASGENFFTSVYTAKRGGETLTLAPPHPGEIRCLKASERSPVMLATGAFMACTEGVKFELKYVGVRGLMSSRGLFLMRTTGEGDVFVSSHGALVERTLEDGERYVLDNRNIVAFAESVQCEMVKVAVSVRDSMLTGEGLVNRYTGPGFILYQTRGAFGRGMVRGLFEMMT